MSNINVSTKTEIDLKKLSSMSPYEEYIIEHSVKYSQQFPWSKDKEFYEIDFYKSFTVFKKIKVLRLCSHSNL